MTDDPHAHLITKAHRLFPAWSDAMCARWAEAVLAAPGPRPLPYAGPLGAGVLAPRMFSTEPSLEIR